MHLVCPLMMFVVIKTWRKKIDRYLQVMFFPYANNEIAFFPGRDMSTKEIQCVKCMHYEKQ